MIRLGERQLRPVLAWLAIVLLVVPVGGALWLGVAHGESPCILCWAQRTSMILMALTVLFVVRYGPRPRYVGTLVILGAWGLFMAFRHWSLHLARDVGQGFAATILGAHTYTWSWVIHWVVLLVGGGLLLMLKGPLEGRIDRDPGPVSRFAMALMVVLVGANALQAFASTGPPPFMGQADPVRLSPDPRHWIWSTAEISGAVGWRGSWAIPEPDPGRVVVDPDPGNGPLTDLPPLSIVRWERIDVPLEGAVTGFAAGVPPGSGGVAAEPGGFLVTTEGFGVWLLEPGLSRVRARVILDPAYSVHLTPLAGAAFVGPDTLAVLSTNKSYVLLRADPDADPDREWRHFLETDGGVEELRRSRFGTVRARQMYALSLAYDAGRDELITVAVPSPRHRALVVSRFDRSDWILSSEFLPMPGPGLRVDPDRGMGDYVVTGATVADGLLYAISAAYSTLLVIDPGSERIEAAYAVPGLESPVGLAARGDQLLVAQADGRVAVLERPMLEAPDG